MTPETWYQMGRQLGQRRQEFDRGGSRQMWAIGDWMLAGEHDVHQGLKRARLRDLAVEATGYSRHTLTMASTVARKVKPAVRVDGLSWWHHLAVSGLGEEEQSEWLARAAEAEWTVPGLRERLTAAGRIRSRSAGRTQRLVGEIVKLHLSDLSESTRAELRAWWDRESGARTG